jgi:hypothetical protein
VIIMCWSWPLRRARGVSLNKLVEEWATVSARKNVMQRITIEMLRRRSPHYQSS